MLKKQLLTAMEGKHHDALPPYTRKDRHPATVQAVAAEVAEVKSWTCLTCDTMVEAEGRHFRACAQYWTDVENGLFDDDF